MEWNWTDDITIGGRFICYALLNAESFLILDFFSIEVDAKKIFTLQILRVQKKSKKCSLCVPAWQLEYMCEMSM